MLKMQMVPRSVEGGSEVEGDTAVTGRWSEGDGQRAMVRPSKYRAPEHRGGLETDLGGHLDESVTRQQSILEADSGGVPSRVAAQSPFRRPVWWWEGKRGSLGALETVFTLGHGVEVVY